jgi:hypothetical protein
VSVNGYQGVILGKAHTASNIQQQAQIILAPEQHALHMQLTQGGSLTAPHLIH